MTNDYKENSLHYLVGDLQQQTGINTPTFNIQQIDNNLHTEIFSQYPILFYFTYIQASNNKHNDLNISILGAYVNKDGFVQGILVLLDENNNIIQIIDKWSNGEPIRNINCMSVDDNGNYYAVERNPDTNALRILELNNIALKLDSQNEYSATILNSYTITGVDSGTRINAIKRNDNASKYFLLYEGSTGIYGKELDTSNNTWTTYTSTSNWVSSKYSTYTFLNNSFNVYWDNDNNLHFQIATYSSNQLSILTNDGTTTMQKTPVFTNTVAGYTFDDGDFVFLSNEVGYLALTLDNGTYNKYQLFKVNVLNNSHNKLIDTNVDYYENNTNFVFKGGNTIFYTEYTSLDGTDDNIQVDFGLVDDMTITSETIGTMAATDSRYFYCILNVYINYNQFKVYLQGQNTLFINTFNWNENEYNGEEFISYGSLVPQKASIIDSNNEEIYNRNLFTLTSYLNTYTATLNVPHELLNGITFDRTNLYSKNNNLMIRNNLTTTKNKFEELNINFNQTFDIVDNQNNKNINASADLVKNMLNESINGVLTKARINYQDNTNRIISVSVCDSNPYYANLEFAFYVNKAIKNIELLSDDENTIYHTIYINNLELNKYYLVKQKVKIE